jgi:SAM-dependent methyltransferase
MVFSPQRITEIATAYWSSAALLAAAELDLFECIASDGRDAERIARLAGSDVRYTQMLLDALAGMGLVLKREQVYSLEPTAAPWLTGAASMTAALKYNRDLYLLWGQLPQAVRTGQPVVPPEAQLGGDPDRTRRFVTGMHSRAMGLLPGIVPMIDLPDHARVLDLGCGPGTFSRLLAERFANASFTLLDLPPVLDVARSLLDDHPARPRLTFHPGSYLTDALPAGFDAVVFSGAMHQHSPDQAVALVRKIHDALLPGGRVHIVDLMLEPDRTQPLFSVMFQITMRLFRPDAHVHVGEDLLLLLEDTGFSDAGLHRAAQSPYWVVRASKA